MAELELYELLFILGYLIFIGVYFSLKIVFNEKQKDDDFQSLLARVGLVKTARVGAGIVGVQNTKWWSKLGAKLAPKNPKELEVIHQRLIKAGHKDPEYIGGFYFVRLALMAGVGLIGLLLWALHLAPIYVALLGSLISYIIPERLLDYLGNRRESKITQSLPDFLDMVNVGIGAGLSWVVSMQRVAEELKNLHPEICSEFVFLQEQIQIGMPRTEALKQLAKRIPVKDIEQLANILIQNEKLGSPISEALSTFSKRMYDEREEIMSEKAAKTSAKMALVIMPFLMLPYMILLVGEKMVMLGRGF